MTWWKLRWYKPQEMYEHLQYIPWFMHSVVLCFVLCVISSCRICAFHFLTHWGQNKMADILQTTFCNSFYWIKMVIFYSIFTDTCSKDPISRMPALVQIMAWRLSGDKPLSDPMMAQFIDTYASLGLNELRLLHWHLGNCMWSNPEKYE